MPNKSIDPFKEALYENDALRLQLLELRVPELFEKKAIALAQDKANRKQRKSRSSHWSGNSCYHYMKNWKHKVMTMFHVKQSE